MVRGRDAVTTRLGGERTLGATTGDVVIALSAVCLVAALLYPVWSARSFRVLVDEAVADVETLSAAARSARDGQGRWPSPAAPGEAPPELSSLAREGGLFDRTEYTLGWTSWQVVDSVEAPPNTDVPAAGDQPPDSVGPRMLPVVRRVGAVAVHSGNESLLAELTARYAERRPFVLDTIWMLVLPERAAAP
jgi:type II secretory pathway pseudopilin PulG